MENKVNVISESEHEIEVSLTAEEIKTDLDTEVAKKAKNIQIDGFRKGKAPKHVIKKLFGDALEYEAAEKVANKKFWEIVQSGTIRPLGEPVLTDLNFKPGEDLNFKVQYEIMPVIEPKNYTGHTIDVPDYQAKDEEVQMEIDKLREQTATFEETDVVDGKEIQIDIDIYKVDEEGKVAEEVFQKDLQVQLNNPQVNQDIPNNADGKKVGDRFRFTFEDNSEYAEKKELSKTITFEAEIKKIQKIIIPELTEELVKKLTRDQISNEEELRTRIKEDIQNYYDENVEKIIGAELEKILLDNNDFEPPKTLVENYLKDVIKAEMEERKKRHAKVPTEEELREELKDRAINTIKWMLIRDAIVDKENIEVSEERIKEIAEQNAEKMGVSVDVLINHYKRDDMKGMLINQEFTEFMKNNNEIKRISREEFAEKMKEANNESNDEPANE